MRVLIIPLIILMLGAGCGSSIRQSVRAKYPGCDAELIKSAGKVEIYEIDCGSRKFTKTFHRK